MSPANVQQPASARGEMGMVKEGEIFVQLVEPPAAPAGEQPPAPTVDE